MIDVDQTLRDENNALDLLAAAIQFNVRAMIAFKDGAIKQGITLAQLKQIDDLISRWIGYLLANYNNANPAPEGKSNKELLNEAMDLLKTFEK